MKVRLRFGNVELEAEGETHRDVFKELSSMIEVFRSESCGLCGKDNSIFIVRRVADPKSKGKKEFEYYKRRCLTKDCRGRLAYGQHNEGGSLFLSVKRKLVSLCLIVVGLGGKKIKKSDKKARQKPGFFFT
jgi:hypothetical protein